MPLLSRNNEEQRRRQRQRQQQQVALIVFLERCGLSSRVGSLEALELAAISRDSQVVRAVQVDCSQVKITEINYANITR